MAEYGDHEWEIEEMSLTGLMTRIYAARDRQEARRHREALFVASLHNTALMIRAPHVKREPAKPLTMKDVLRAGPRTVDERVFREREARRYDRHLRRLMEKGRRHVEDYMPTRSQRERQRFAEAARRFEATTHEEHIMVDYVARVAA